MVGFALLVLVGTLAATGTSLLAGAPGSRPASRPATRPAVALSPEEAARARRLVARLGSSDPDVRESSLDALRDLGERAVPFLVEGLRDASPAVRAGCARALGLAGSADAVGPLVALLAGEESSGVRLAAAGALGALGSLESLPALVETLGDTVPAVRAEAALAVGQAVRIARARGRLSARERALLTGAVEPLIEALRDRDAAVRGNAAISLGVTGDRRALLPLGLATLDGDPLVRASACHGLGELGDPSAGAALVECLDDRDPTVRRSAIEALHRLAGTDLGYRPHAAPAERRAAVLRWRAWWNRTRSRLRKNPPALPGRNPAPFRRKPGM